MTPCGIAINAIQVGQNFHEPFHVFGSLTMNDIKINGTCRRAMQNGGGSAHNDKFHAR